MDADVAQIHAFLEESAGDERRDHFRTGLLELGVGAAVLGGAGYYWFQPNPSTEERVFRLAAFEVGSMTFLWGAAHLFFAGRGDLMELTRKAANGESKEAVEQEWAKRVSEAHSRRVSTGATFTIIGGAAMAMGVGFAFFEKNVLGTYPSDSIVFLSGGAMFALLGVTTWLSETPVEHAHRLWRAGTETETEVSFGIAPLPGGGSASFAATF